ncbi:MAG TPA: chromate transporter [Blastocatellia bacterium]|nr:chromate transporter [Blastocatellia bacterium]
MTRLRQYFKVAREFITSHLPEKVEQVPKEDWRTLIKPFLRVGATGFGGGIAVIAQIRRLVVSQKRWLSEEEFLDAVSLAQSLPGANAVNAISYIGLKVAGLRGALVAASSFILPSFLMMIGLTIAHNYLNQLPDAQRVFQGFNAAVVGLIGATVFKIGQTAMQRQWHLEMGVAVGFILIFTSTSIAEIVLLAGMAGIFIQSFKRQMRERVRQKVKREKREKAHEALAEKKARKHAAEMIEGAEEYAVQHRVEVSLPMPGEIEKPIDDPPSQTPSSGDRILSLVWPLLVLLAIPYLSELLAKLWATWKLATVFLRIGSVTFGGGFVMIPQIETDVVEVNRWLTHEEFADGMAFGQITPGPVMITATFIGYKVAGLLGAIAATIAAFLPSFVMTIVAGTSLNRFRANHLVQSFLSGVAPAVVGMLAAAGVSLARSSLSTTLSYRNIPVSFGIATLAFLLMMRARLNPVLIIFGCGALQLIISKWLVGG